MSVRLDSNRTRLAQSRYDRVSRVYDLVEWWSERTIRKWRRSLWARVNAGKVLEVGVGTGKNLAHHPSGSEMIAVDLSPGMMDQAKRKAQMLNSDVRFAFMDAQSLALQDESFDYVVATFVFCSVPDPVLGLMELGRVCKPDGFILLLEHVRSHLPVFGRVMDWLNPLAVRLTGANINRNTAENVRRAGLEILSIENLMMAGMVKLVTARPARDAG